jgi:hypothetical protein
MILYFQEALIQIYIDFRTISGISVNPYVEIYSGFYQNLTD